jgi:hypothetical protein
MEMFNTHRRDILNFDNYMDLKKPGFGGPASAIAQRDGKGNKINKDPKLAGYSRVVERDPAFSHPVYDPTYKAMSGDLVYKQEKKKPYTYDHSVTGIPMVEVGETNEGLAFNSFTRFINENETDELETELRQYETEDDEFVDTDEYGANPYESEEDYNSDEEYNSEEYDEFEDEGEYGANPFNEEPTEDIKRWLEGLKTEQGANPYESEEDYDSEEYDEPLYGPEEDEENEEY